MDAQIRSLTLVQRDGHCQRLDVYRIEKGHVDKQDSQPLPIPNGEVKIASIQFRVPGSDKVWSVNFWAVDRRFTLMSFNDSYRPIRNESEVEIVRRKVLPTMDK